VCAVTGELRGDPDGFLRMRDFPKLRAQLAGCQCASFFDDTSGLSILPMRAKAGACTSSLGLKLIVIDYLHA